MRIFLDHCTPKRLMRHFPEHEVVTAYKRGWSTLKNGELLNLVETEFDVFLTVDQNIKYQQNLRGRTLRIIVLVASDNQYKTLLPLVPIVKKALEKIAPGELVEVS